MGFLKNLFGSKAENGTETNVDNNQQAQQKIKRNIFDFFHLDIRNIPDDSFVEAEVETNTSGEKVANYRKTLDYKECVTFDTVEVKVIGEKVSKNVFLKSFQPDTVKVDNLKKLIDDLYLIHGNDSMDKGKFTSKDIEEYRSSDFFMLFGRSWSDYPKYKFPVTVGRDEDEVSISIWGVHKDEQ